MKKNLFLTALIAAALAGCTSSEVLDEGVQSNAIGFTNVVDKQSRAVDGDLTNGTFDNFLVYGYYVKGNSNTPVQIFNGVPVMKTKDNGAEKWTYDGTRYWVPECTYYFYAYSCADVALTSGKGSPAMTLTNETMTDGRALAIMSYLCDGTHQHDLVCAESEGIIGQEKGNPQVALQFNHALCKIKAAFTTDFPAGYQVKITNVRISEFNNVADYNVGSGVWSSFNTVGNPSINMAVDENNNVITNAPESVVETSEVFLIPKQHSSTEFVKLHFSIELSKDGQVVLQRNINGTWSPKWESARIYKYNINITGSSSGIEPIVFAASQQLGGNSWDSSTEVNMVFGVDTNAKSSDTGK